MLPSRMISFMPSGPANWRHLSPRSRDDVQQLDVGHIGRAPKLAGDRRIELRRFAVASVEQLLSRHGAGRGCRPRVVHQLGEQL